MLKTDIRAALISGHCADFDWLFWIFSEPAPSLCTEVKLIKIALLLRADILSCMSELNALHLVFYTVVTCSTGARMSPLSKIKN